MSVIQNALKNYFATYPIPIHTSIAVAVSGGADSLCLSYHLAQYARDHKIKLYALTVNHALRSEALSEAKMVANQMSKLGVPHTILTWCGKKPATHIEEKAREKRYELMLNWCQKQGVSHLFLAHHVGDQVETFWARLARGSGIDGLSAMGYQTTRSGVFLCRPFLSLTKKECQSDLKKHKISWAEDPMNKDETYERVRWRHAQRDLSQLGLTEKAVERTIQRINRAKTALDFYAKRFETALVDWMPKGYATIQEKAFFSLPKEIQIRVLTSVLKSIGQGKYPVSLENLEKWVELYPQKANFHHCYILRHQGLLYIFKELVRMEKSKRILKNKLITWNGFLVKSPVDTYLKAGSIDQDLPHLVRQSIPMTTVNLPISFKMGTQKELEKEMQVDYKDLIQIGFIKETI